MAHTSLERWLYRTGISNWRLATRDWDWTRLLPAAAHNPTSNLPLPTSNMAQAHYDPWGNRIAASGSLVQPMRYAGYYYDDETGLYYLKSRYYSPVLGRFLTRDGIGFISKSDPQTLNLYSYCGNNPISFTDPDGNYKKGDENLPPDVRSQIAEQEDKWNKANKKGNAKGKKDAEKEADAIRAAARARMAEIDKSVLKIDVTIDDVLNANQYGNAQLSETLASNPNPYVAGAGVLIGLYDKGKTVVDGGRNIINIVSGIRYRPGPETVNCRETCHLTVVLTG